MKNPQIIVITLLSVAVVGLGVFAGVQTANLAKANEEISSLKKSENKSIETDKTDSNKNSGDMSNLKKVNVSGKSIADACKALEDAGWFIQAVVDNEYHKMSCSDEGVATNAYYYESDGEVMLYVK